MSNLIGFYKIELRDIENEIISLVDHIEEKEAELENTARTIAGMYDRLTFIQDKRAVITRQIDVLSQLEE